jgi:hypothetical protein
MHSILVNEQISNGERHMSPSLSRAFLDLVQSLTTGRSMFGSDFVQSWPTGHFDPVVLQRAHAQLSVK